MSPEDPYDDARLYDVIVGDEAAGIAFYRELADAHPGRILELGCGTGRLSVPLAEDGRDVTGLDRAEPMLERARSKSEQVTWVQQDMRDFEVEGTFSLIFIAFNTLLHLHKREEYEALLATVRAHLAPDGVFALDVFNPDPEILARAPETRHQVSTVLDPERRRAMIIEEVTRYDRRTQASRTLWYVSYPKAPDARVLDLDLRILFPEELLALLHYNGFEVLKHYGDYDQSGFESTSRLQLLVTRPTPESTDGSDANDQRDPVVLGVVPD